MRVGVISKDTKSEKDKVACSRPDSREMAMCGCGSTPCAFSRDHKREPSWGSAKLHL